MNDSEFDQLLKTNAAPLKTPAGFQRDVWFRIEADEASAWKPRAHRIVEQFFGFFAMPSVAVATCSAMVVAGAWFGLESAKPGVPNEISYVRSISPFDSTHH